eukprot:TRINITY_DN79409_c0_g1_i1.p2 TRINITY_DN79409_c0_g1~~TRINITY_DN79409_c0_g1_i1.p2  ORF type:complete len:133 (-),score=19.04 TRINITY_DN79409_c0_g1_i1:111-509(-)
MLKGTLTARHVVGKQSTLPAVPEPSVPTLVQQTPSSLPSRPTSTLDRDLAAINLEINKKLSPDDTGRLHFPSVHQKLGNQELMTFVLRASMLGFTLQWDHELLCSRHQKMMTLVPSLMSCLQLGALCLYVRA